ncbi:DNA segregation ATPase FtsK/SpoIIIE, S-DNA-T family [Friedmanniella luteola]|uniref:DNA segregation ATPase FtsK/SpoIIIE, S-DNA-T family n=1 Tax=Friedmanniella luteola TaxID=546871 RepID=A0A1H1LCS2_9ACTN|nr:FtsK/SpoIIIE domain-containing protein [Friedmanniella luteola]SDR72391.1 DNA segregation ATPase FtsK/SpoIIIE, S-DNA-T family [Friedmanniella luteola]
MAGLSQARSDQPVQLRSSTVRVGAGLAASGWVLRRLWRLAVVTAATPAALAGLLSVILSALLWSVSPLLMLSMLALGIGLLVGVRSVWPDRWLVWLRLPLRSWWRGWLVYRRCWPAAMDTAGLATSWRGTVWTPTVLTVSSTLSVDRVRVRMLPGQTVEDYADVAHRLAQTFGASAVRVRSVLQRPHHVELWLLTVDPLTSVVEPLPVDDQALTEGLPLALAEDGRTWRLQLVGSHVLVVGATGAGKGSVIWSLLLHLAPLVRSGLVAVWAVDPKGGMELAAGRRLFARFAHGDSDAAAGYESTFAEVLEDAVAVMRRRQDRLRGVTRLHTPSTAEPLVVLVVDELAALTGWVTDRTAKKRIEAALGLLLSQGRAVGVVVVGAVQDPRKDVLPMRDLFPTRIALRLNEAEQVNLVLGPGARNRGAHADLIPDGLPGVGYVTVDGIAEPVRVRFSNVTDQHIAQLVTPVTPALQLVSGEAA